MEREFIRDFIKVYQEHPNLWNTKCKEYTNKNLKPVAYAALVNICRKYNIRADVDLVKRKIQCLRSSFRKEYKKVQESIKNGNGEYYYPTLWYYELLLFTQEPQEAKENVDNPTTSDDDEEAVEIIFAQPLCDEENSEFQIESTHMDSAELKEIELPTTESKDEISPIKLKEIIPFMTESKDKNTPIQLKNIKISSIMPVKRKTQTEGTEANAKKVCPSLCVYDNVNDNVIETAAGDSDPFGVYVGKKMKCIKSEKQKILAECLITTVLKKAILNTLSENTTVIM